MTCPECKAAEVGPHHLFRSGCDGCKARAVARGPNFHASLRAGRLTQRYRDELVTLGVTHDEVKAARAKDLLSSAPTK